MQVGVLVAVVNVGAAVGALYIAISGHRLMALLPLVIALLVDCAWFFWYRRRGQRLHIDAASRYMAQSSEAVDTTTEGVARTAATLGLDHLETPGLYLGKNVRGGHDVWGSWESTYIEIAGPGTGKTSCRAIPNIVAAPGPVLVTSCKADIVEATRGVRDKRGRTWVFDPQNVMGEAPTWYWNPLSMVGGDIKDATTIAGLFMSTQRKPHMQSDAYFDSAAQTLIGLLLFAGNAINGQVTDVYRWLQHPDDDTPAQIIRDARHELAAQAYEGMVQLPNEQKAGVYGAAQSYMSWLAVPEILQWITAGNGREEFPWVSFSRESTDTLYVLSRTDDKTASPAVSCLTAAAVIAGETGSAKMPGGRLPRPFLVVLDEAANVAQLQLWPNRYSHYGSRGIIMMTMLQSWSQGAGVWGAAGMGKLWGASSVRVVGSGGTEAGLLGDMTKVAGIFEASTTGLSGGRWDWFASNVKRGSRPENVLHRSDLTSLPRDRAFVQISGQKPILLKSVPWTETPYADEIRASIAKYGNGHAGEPR